WRSWPDAFGGLWQRSLRFRTVLTTLAFTSVAIVVTYVAMSLAIQNNLWDSRKDQVLQDAGRAVAQAQSTLSAADTRGDRTALEALMRDVRGDIASVSASAMFAAFRIDTEPSVIAPQNFSKGG